MIQCGNIEYLLCDSGDQCVRKEDICHGYPVCKDSSDIQHCQKERDIFDHDYRFSKCQAIPTGHHECYKTRNKNNREYNCLSRSDEDILVENRALTIIDYNSISPCNSTIRGDRGNALLCGKYCVYIEEWCNPNKPSYSCGDFTTQDTVLCGNHTFWSTVDCDFVDRFEGIILMYGKRCSGKYQHCYYPPYLSFDYEILDLEHTQSRALLMR